MGLLHTFQVEHPHGSLYDDVNSSGENKSSLAIKAFFEKHQSSRVLLLLVVLLGTSMVIGDGILTPTMSGTFWFMIPLFFFFCLDIL